MFSHALAQLLEHDHSDLVLSEMSKQARTGKVFVDWSQNDEHKTTIAVYSLRAREHPTVSTPVTWEEVERALKKKDAGLLVFEATESGGAFREDGRPLRAGAGTEAEAAGSESGRGCGERTGVEAHRDCSAGGRERSAAEARQSSARVEAKNPLVRPDVPKTRPVKKIAKKSPAPRKKPRKL